MNEDKNTFQITRGTENGCISGLMCLVSGALAAAISGSILEWKPVGIAGTLLRAGITSAFLTFSMVGVVGAIWGFFNPRWVNSFATSTRRVMFSLAGVFVVTALFVLWSSWWFN
jgi:membrane associated rhomboid family serine protease